MADPSDVPEPPSEPREAAVTPLYLRLRRERVFLILAGIFLGCLTMLNIIGLTRFLVIGSWDDDGFHLFTPGDGGYTFALAAGVLPYPLTFLCTDLISEFYGRRRANWVVLVGLLLNGLVFGIIWLGTTLPGFGPPQESLLWDIRVLAFSSIYASMIAYMAAQFCDVYLFHYLKARTAGGKLWIRNNGSTLVSQFIDTFAVITIGHYLSGAIPGVPEGDPWPTLWTFILTGYVFKAVAALLDTPVIYGAVWLLRDYLQIDPAATHGDEVEAAGGM